MSISCKERPLPALFVLLLLLLLLLGVCFSAQAEVDLRLSHGIRGLSHVSLLNTNNGSVQNEFIRTLKEDKDKETVSENEDDAEDEDDGEEEEDDEEDGDNGDADIDENGDQNGNLEEVFEEPPVDNGLLLGEDDTLVVSEFLDDDDASLGLYPVETQAPPISETFVPTTSPTTAQTEVVTTSLFNVTLASFTISLDYVEPIDADPGIEEYLTNELLKSFDNLVAVCMEFSGSPAENDGVRRNLLQQVLSYAGSVTFKGDPFRGEEEVQSVQASILADRSAISAVIAESLGTDTNNFAISAIESQNDLDEADSSKGNDPNGDFSTTGLILVIIAAVVGAVSLPFIWLAALSKKDPNAIDVSRDLGLAPELVDRKSVKGELGATFDTEQASLNCDDWVHEEFAKNMETHSFSADWEPVSISPQATSLDKQDYCVGELGQPFNNSGTPPDESTGADTQQLKRELVGLSVGVQTARDKARNLQMKMELNNLHASIKAAKEKTKKLLEDAHSP